MVFILDTHIFISFSRESIVLDYPKHAKFLNENDVDLVLSVASIWEISIKTQIGKLTAGIAPELIDQYCVQAGISVLPIKAQHASLTVEPQPQTRDPFDRMLLSQCAVEGMKLITADGLLIGHPLVVNV